MSSTESTVVAILLYPGLTALDAIGPYEVLHGLPGIEVRFVWKEVGPLMADSGVLVLGATHSLAESRDVDVVIVPGSSADTPVIMGDDEVLDWLREVHQKTRYTTSVCTGALILAAAGILDGLPATTHWAAMPALRGFGVEPRSDDRVVRAGKVITAAGVSAGIDMALSLAAELCGERAAKVAQLWIEYDPAPPFDSGHLSKADPEVIRIARRVARENAANVRSLAALPAIVVNSFTQFLRRVAR